MSSYRFDPLGAATIDQLIEMAAREASIAGESGSADVHHGRARTCLEIANLRLTQEDQLLRHKQIDIEKLTNSLRERNLQVNEESAQAAAQSSAAMNSATAQLAKSTSGLNKATWILAVFTVVQALTAIFSLVHPVMRK